METNMVLLAFLKNSSRQISVPSEAFTVLKVHALLFNPYLTNGFSHHYQMNGSTFNFRGVRSNSNFFYLIFR